METIGFGRSDGAVGHLVLDTDQAGVRVSVVNEGFVGFESAAAHFIDEVGLGHGSQGCDGEENLLLHNGFGRKRITTEKCVHSHLCK